MTKLASLSLALLVPALAGAAAPSACTILTKAEIQEVVGKAPSDGKVDPNNSTVCHFEIGAPNMVTIGLQSVVPANNGQKALAELTKQKSEIQMVPGLGDLAFFVKAYGMNSLSVYKGSKVISVVVFHMSVPEAKSKAFSQALARKALTRL